MRFGVSENHLTDKTDHSRTTIKAEMETVLAKTCQLENCCCAAPQDTQRANVSVTELEDRILKIFADLDEKMGTPEVFPGETISNCFKRLKSVTAPDDQPSDAIQSLAADQI